MNPQTYGWLPDLPDQRDKVFHAVPGQVLPSHIDLRAGCTAVEDQGALGSCTAQAIVGAVEFANKRDGVYDDLSRLFIYYEERVIEHTTMWDAGAQIRDGIKVVAGTGVPHETFWPYDIDRFRRRPTTEAYKHASEHRIRVFQRCMGLTSVKASIAQGFPVVFGFTVYESFESPEVARTGMMPLPADHERVLGGHAVLAVGYDDDSSRLIVRNSWGAAWGAQGYFFMPYEYIVNADLSADFWRIEK